ncbi:MAG TPA: class III extradiol ring-cleavage dioxygenase [Candidatus Limnocylindrales bacterium]|nr:class III extradiol ring-cleavage dioxygenase [Candidatus Limnocylindrales bacterium]
MDEELKPQGPQAAPPAEVERKEATVVSERARARLDGSRMPTIYIGHGAPPLVDDELWVTQLAAWARALPRPAAVLIVSAHWENAPLTIGATRTGTPLIYDFGGFPERYYRAQYRSPGAPELAAQIRQMLSDQHVADDPERGLDHGAYVPLSVMYPNADIPVLQISMPTLDPQRLFEIGRRLRPLRDQGVLIIGSGFLTHGLPFLRDFRFDAPPPEWSVEFDAWAHEALERGNVDELEDFLHKAPAVRYAHPRTEHLAPLFVTLGAGDVSGEPLPSIIDGYWMGLSKRSIQVP